MVLATSAPFNLQATVRVLQRRPTNLVDVWEGRHYHRALTVERTRVLAKVVNRGTIAAPDLHLSVLADGPTRTLPEATLPSVAKIVRRVLGLDVDPEPFQQLAHAVPALRPAIRALHGMRPPRFTGLFETFANVVPFQQLSLDAGVAIVGRLVKRFGQHLDHDGRRFYGFPEAGLVADARIQSLRACGLSQRKAGILRDLARSVASGALAEDRIVGLPTQRALEILVELPGIGPWSAAVVLLRGFGRLDVFPPGDVGATRGLSTLLNIDPGAPLTRLVKRCGDQRGYLYFLSLGSRLLAEGQIQSRDGSFPESHSIGDTEAKGPQRASRRPRA